MKEVDPHIPDFFFGELSYHVTWSDVKIHHWCGPGCSSRTVWLGIRWDSTPPHFAVDLRARRGAWIVIKEVKLGNTRVPRFCQPGLLAIRSLVGELDCWGGSV